LEISAAAGLDSNVKQSFERLPLYFGPRLAERLPGRLQIGAFACEYPSDLRGNGCSNERRGCARRPIERRPSSISRRVGGLHPGMLQKIFFRQNLSGLSFAFDKRRAKPALLNRKHADESRGRRRIYGNPALSQHFLAGESPFSFKSFLAAFNLRCS
jgi:hypothetical protein